MVFDPGVQIKPVEGDGLASDGDLGEGWVDLEVETIDVHAEVPWRIAKPDEAGLDVAHRHLRNPVTVVETRPGPA